jgi:hypothetical protein
MSGYLRLLNSFLHDVATGTWVASLLVVWLLSGRLDGVPVEAGVALGDAMWLVFWLAAGSLAAIVVTGAVRLAYWRLDASPDEREMKRRALLAKHAAFVMVYGLGTWWMWARLP